MKKILAVLFALVITGCGGERSNQISVGSCGAVYTVIVEGHKYIIYDGYHEGGIRSQKCRNVSSRRLCL